MKNRHWKIASAYTQGRSHIANNTPCQDRTFKLIKKHKTGTFYGLSLADGAGSCKYSDIGAEIATYESLIFLKSKFSFLFSKQDPAKYIISHIESKLKDKAKANGYNFNELSSTLLFIAIKNNQFIIGHIGDGVIGMLDGENKISTISQPENGEFANSTYFTTSLKYKTRLRIIKGNLKNSLGFILMSDGTEESLYDKKNKKLIDTNAIIINWLESNDEEDVEKALSNNLKDVISKKTTDDCSVGVIRRV